MPEEMIIADSQEDLDKIPCPRCKQHTLKMTSVRYACPLLFIAHCTNCVFSEEAHGLPIKVYEGEEAVKLNLNMYGEWGAREYPHLYLDHKDDVLRKIAEAEFNEYPCPECGNSTVVCNCVSSCNCCVDEMGTKHKDRHTDQEQCLRYCEHCEDTFWIKSLLKQLAQQEGKNEKQTF